MRLKPAVMVLAVAAMAACGGGKNEGVVKFKGLPPDTSKQLAQDTRTVQTFCPGCGAEIAVDTERCPDKNRCGVTIRWPEDYPCGSCQGSGRCTACIMMEQVDGKCYNCKGTGLLVFQGKSSDCPNCKGQKVCPICKGDQKCDFCKGAGRVPKDVIKAKAAAAAPPDDGTGASTQP